jgi:hypothetical protein
MWCPGLGTPNFKILANLVINNSTIFPSLGAFPAGPQAEKTSSSHSSDEKSCESCKMTFSLAIAALTVSIVTLLIVLLQW